MSTSNTLSKNYFIRHNKSSKILEIIETDLICDHQLSLVPGLISELFVVRNPKFIDIIKAVFSGEIYFPQPSSKNGDLENQGKITRIFSTLYCVSVIHYITFDQNPSFSSKDIKRIHNFGQNLKFQSTGVTLKVR